MLLPLLVPLLVPSLPQDAPASEPSAPRNVAIVVFDGVELLDFAGPGEVFSAARAGGRHAFRVYTVAGSTEPLVSQGFVTVTPAYTFEDCPAPDIVVVPGGGVPLRDRELRGFVQESAERCELFMSVCNGAGVLAAAGLLDGLTATTHWGALDLLAQSGATPTSFASFSGVVMRRSIEALPLPPGTWQFAQLVWR